MREKTRYTMLKVEYNWRLVNQTTGTIWFFGLFSFACMHVCVICYDISLSWLANIKLECLFCVFCVLIWFCVHFFGYANIVSFLFFLFYFTLKQRKHLCNGNEIVYHTTAQHFSFFCSNDTKIASCMSAIEPSSWIVSTSKLLSLRYHSARSVAGAAPPGSVAMTTENHRFSTCCACKTD